MRFVNVRELKSKTSEILRAAARDDIIVTNHGKPVAVVSGIEAGDLQRIGKRSGIGRVEETHAPYRVETVADVTSREEPPIPLSREKPGGNTLRAVFWDYPALTGEKAVREYLEEARRAPEGEAFRWLLTRFLERGRVVDVRKFFGWGEIRSALPHLKLTPYARKKWTRMLEVYDRA